ncbi:NAD(P)-dependent oxidoreductase [Dyella sp.]|jgi:UDP-glucose 4-epimerase|uniref:NAD-dependent epimerase/dehydratase family protein n=1 Tax=Dyella sp. TaxID=1869338 RepID=UPI002D797D56|nr:NAD(P)-dependent oxidoreductase [Dyella sp.]HET6430803.1 NAD(P)-dependent oxidoreductase [Dyella sp.]
MQRALITGANGFLAQTLLAALPADYQAFALVRAQPAAHTRAIRTFDSLDVLIRETPAVDVVFHLAACIPPDHDKPNAELLRSNVDLVSRLVQAYPEARHVYASSVAVYGTPASLPVALDAAPIGASRYGLAKLAGECVARQAASHAAIRFASIIGTGMRPGSFIPAAVAGAKAGRIMLRGDGTRLQNYVDVGDAAHMCLLAASMPGSFVGHGIGERSHSNLEVAKLLADLTGASVVKEGVDHSPSFEYAQDTFSRSVTTRVSLKETLARMIAA